MFDHDQNRIDVADRFYLSVKEERLAREVYDQGEDDVAGGNLPVQRLSTSSTEWRSAQNKILQRADEYLAHNINELGRDFDKFNDPQLVQAAETVELVLSGNLGGAPEHVDRRLAVLQFLTAEPERALPDNIDKDDRHFANLTRKLNRLYPSAAVPGPDNDAVKPFDDEFALDLVAAVAVFRGELDRQLSAAPKVNTAYWLDDFDAIRDPKFKPDYAGYDDDDSDDASSDEVKPLFRSGRPSDNLQRFPDGMSFDELQAEINRVRLLAHERAPVLIVGDRQNDDIRRLAQEPAPATGREPINPVFAMKPPVGAAPVLNLTPQNPDGQPPPKRHKPEGMTAEPVASQATLPNLRGGDSGVGELEGPSTSGQETRDRSRAGGRGI